MKVRFPPEAGLMSKEGVMKKDEEEREKKMKTTSKEVQAE
jgi:hypothetical protein